MGHCDPIKVKLDSSKVQGCILHMLFPGMYYAYDRPKLLQLGHTDLITYNYVSHICSTYLSLLATNSNGACRYEHNLHSMPENNKLLRPSSL